jgi:DNA-binding NtrC family response regulator
MTPTPDTRSDSAGADRHPHVLVVDDSEVVCRYVRDVLELSGHRASIAEDGAAALRLCAGDPPEVVITDLAMTPMSGRELIETLRREHPTIVPVVLTGYGTVERTVDLMRVGAFDVLTKPCREKEITATVEKAYAHHRALKARDELLARMAAHEEAATRGHAARSASAALLGPLEEALERLAARTGRPADARETEQALGLARASLTAMVRVLRACRAGVEVDAGTRAPLRAPRPVAEIEAALEAAVREATGILHAGKDASDAA